MQPNTRIAVLDLSFHWPPTGGSWVDIAHVSKGLMNRGADVRLFVPRVDTGGLKRGSVAGIAPIPVEPIPVTLSAFHALRLPHRMARAVRDWQPDHIILANTFALAPWIINSIEHPRLYLRIYGYELLCPNYMSLWPHGKVRNWARTNPRGQWCRLNYIDHPGRCTFCALRGMGRELLPRWMNPFSHEYVASLGFLPTYHATVVKALNRCRRIIVSNSYTAGILSTWKGKISVVPGGVDTSRFRPAEAASAGDRNVVLMPGRVEDPRKGYAVFRAVVHRLKENGHHFHARVTDARYDGNSRYIESLGWTPHEHMPDVYSMARVVVVPTMWPEPFGLVALEAMACGIPVVAHRIGGLTDIVIEGETGFLAEPGDVDYICEKVALLLANDNLWQTMSRKARERACSFHWSKVIDSHYVRLFG